jgi:hypothetical protein
MHRFEQHKRKRLLNPEIAEGYHLINAEFCAGLSDALAEHRPAHVSPGRLMTTCAKNVALLDCENPYK